MVNFATMNKKDVAILGVALILTITVFGLGVALVVKMLDQWRLVVSFLAIGAADAGLIAYIFHYLKKISGAK